MKHLPLILYFTNSNLTLPHPPTLPTPSRIRNLAPRLPQPPSQLCPRQHRFTHNSPVGSWFQPSFKQWLSYSERLSLQITVFPDRSFSIGTIKDPMGLETIYSNNWLNFGVSNNRSSMLWEPGSIFTRLSSRYLSIRSSKNTLLEGMWNCEEYNRFGFSSSVNIFSNMCLYMHGFA